MPEKKLETSASPLRLHTKSNAKLKSVHTLSVFAIIREPVPTSSMCCVLCVWIGGEFLFKKKNYLQNLKPFKTATDSREKVHLKKKLYLKYKKEQHKTFRWLRNAPSLPLNQISMTIKNWIKLLFLFKKTKFNKMRPQLLQKMKFHQKSCKQ